jgi:hypothetical protein
MEQEDIRKLLAELSTLRHGRALRQFLDAELDDIRDVTKYRTWKEAEGGQIAVRLVKKLFSFLEEKKSSVKGPNQYA